MKEHITPQKITVPPKAPLKKKITKLRLSPFLDKSLIVGVIFMLSAVLLNVPRYLWRPLDQSRINIYGDRALSRETIVDYLGIPDDKNWLSLDPYILALRLRQRLWIDKVMVRRKFPLGLDVYIHEEKPAAYLKTERNVYFITGNNLLLNILSSTKNWDYPVIVNENIKGEKPGDKLPASKLRGAWDLMKVLKESSVLPLSAAPKIIISDPLNIQAMTSPRGIKVKFGFKDFKQKLTNLYYALPEIKKNKANIEYIDLRYRRGVVIKKTKSQPSGRPPLRGPAL